MNILFSNYFPNVVIEMARRIPSFRSERFSDLTDSFSPTGRVRRGLIQARHQQNKENTPFIAENTITMQLFLMLVVLLASARAFVPTTKTFTRASSMLSMAAATTSVVAPTEAVLATVSLFSCGYLVWFVGLYGVDWLDGCFGIVWLRTNGSSLGI